MNLFMEKLKTIPCQISRGFQSLYLLLYSFQIVQIAKLKKHRLGEELGLRFIHLVCFVSLRCL